MPTLRMRISGVIEFEVTRKQMAWFESRERDFAERRGSLKLTFGMAPTGYPYIAHDFVEKQVRMERGLV